MIQKILSDREKRYNNIIHLIEQYHMPVLCGKINYPGKDKNTEEAKKAFLVLKEAINNKFSNYSKFTKTLHGYDGSSILIVVQMSSFEAKDKAVLIEENHQLGRLFDIDIYIEDGSSIGRENINKDTRRCIICNDDARICMKTNKHSFEQLTKKINMLIRNY